MKKVISIFMALIMVLTITTGLSFSANAATGYDNSVITSNVAKIKQYIKDNGFINGRGNYTLQYEDYTDSYDFYYLMIVDSSTNELSFKMQRYDTATDDLLSVAELDLSSPTDDIKLLSFSQYEADNDYSIINGHTYLERSFDGDTSRAAYYVDYNYYNLENSLITNVFASETSLSFIFWNDMLEAMGLNLGAVGFYNYCIAHSWNAGKVTKASTCANAGTKTFACTICGKTKTASVAATGKHDYDNGKITSSTSSTYTKTFTCYECEKTKTKVYDKKANTLKAKAKTVKVKLSKLKKNDVKIVIDKAIAVTKAKGTVTYAKTSGNKKITINKKTGKITVKKGLKKGTYKVKIKVSAKGTEKYKKGSKTVTVKVVVK